MPTNNKQVGLTVGQLCADFMSAFGITGLSATSLAQMNKVFQLIQMGYLDEIKDVLRQVATSKITHGKPKRADSIKLKKNFKRLLKIHSSHKAHLASAILVPAGTERLYLSGELNCVTIRLPIGFSDLPFEVSRHLLKGRRVVACYDVTPEGEAL